MALKKEKQPDQEKTETLDAILKELKKDGKIYGTRAGEEILAQNTITTSSFEFDQRIGGGFRSGGWSRFYSEEECGKTSISLCWGRNWQNKFENGFVLFFNAEGRITKDLLERSGINTNPEKFRIVDTNNYESIYTITERAILNNSEGRNYFVVIDSTDACEREIDKVKNIGQAEKMCGGAAIASMAGKRLSLLFNVSNHHLFLSSQMRDRMTKSPRGIPAGKAPSGGNAPKYYSSLTAEIKRPYSKTYIYEEPSNDKSRIIGRICQIKLNKTYNETSGSVVYYPVKYGLKGGVWKAYEAMMVAKACQIVACPPKASWWSFESSLFEDLKSKNINVPEKVQGEAKLRDVFDNNPELVEYVFQKGEVLYSANKFFLTLDSEEPVDETS